LSIRANVRRQVGPIGDVADRHRCSRRSISDPTVGFTYDAASRSTQATLPNGVTIDYAYESGVDRFGECSCAAGA
jgi:hypothetical protein